jgi:hypothetical protein
MPARFSPVVSHHQESNMTRTKKTLIGMALAVAAAVGIGAGLYQRPAQAGGLCLGTGCNFNGKCGPYITQAGCGMNETHLSCPADCK